MSLSQNARRSSSGRIGFTACLMPLMVIVSVAFLVAGSSGPAGAKSKPTDVPPSLAKFANCPVNVASVATCLYSSTTSTTFEIGSTTITSSAPTTLSLGLSCTKSGRPVVVLPDNGPRPFSRPPCPFSVG